MGLKTYFWDEWPCCSGTYIQAIADYHNILFHRDDDGLFVSQTIPSEVQWTQRGAAAKLVVDTRYPDEEEVRMTLTLGRPSRFKLRVRVPSWCAEARFAVNGEAQRVTATPDGWATLDRRWASGDVVTANLPMKARLLPVDGQHPNRVAVMYGPVMMAQDARFSYPISGAPAAVAASLSRKPGDKLALVTAPGDPKRQGGQNIGELVPFHSFEEREPYRSYFDLDRPRFL